MSQYLRSCEEWFVVDVNSALGSLDHIDAGSVVDAVEAHAASIFRV
jgi:hypothetical protein